MQTSRSRSRGPVTYNGTCTEYLNGSLYRSTTHVKDHSYDRMDDVVISEYHRRIAEGEVINNPCDAQFELTRTTGEGSYQAIHTPTGKVFICEGECFTAYHSTRMNLPGRYTPDPFDEADLELLKSDLKVKAIARIDRTPYAFGEDLLELRETVRFIRDPLESLRDLSESFKKARERAERALRSSSRRSGGGGGGLLRSAVSDPRGQALASTWLAFRFALSPLVRSISDLLEAFQTESQPNPRQTARANMEDSMTHTSEVSIGGLDFVKETKHNFEVRAGILTDVDLPSNMTRWKYGLRNKDIPSTLWQILPYSFMVDRLYDVSSVVKGIANLSDPKINILAGWVTTKHEVLTTETYVAGVHPDPNWIVSGQGDVVDTIVSTYVRETWNPGVGDLHPRASLKGLVNDANKILDLVSLVLKNFR